MGVEEAVNSVPVIDDVLSQYMPAESNAGTSAQEEPPVQEEPPQEHVQYIF